MTRQPVAAGGPTAPASDAEARRATVTGNRALMLEEPLIFEIGEHRARPASISTPMRRRRAVAASAGSSASAPIGLPGLSEPRDGAPLHPPVSRQNYAIDLGLFPLGSCTMKHNPRLNEKVARLPGFADIHPLQPSRHGAGRARADRPSSADWLVDADRHARRGDEPQGRRAWRAVRPAVHPRRARGARRRARGGAGARKARTAPTRRPRPSPAIGSRTSRPTPRGRVDLDALKARLGPGRRRR